MAVTVLIFHSASSDTTTAGGGRRYWVQVDVQAPHRVSTGTPGGGVNFLLAWMKVPAPWLAFSDTTVVAELVQLVIAWAEQKSRLPTWPLLAWVRGNTALSVVFD